MASNKIEPKITLDNEDRAAYIKERKTPASQSKFASAAEVKPASSTNSLSLFLLLVIALGGYGASWWLYQQTQQQSQLIAKAESRIADLEQQLSATGEEMGESAVAMQVKVSGLVEKTDKLWTEMDKLWASAWRRNQSEIKSLNSKLIKQDKQVTANVKTAEQAAQQVTAIGTRTQTLQTNLAQLKQSVAQQDSQVRELKETLLLNQADSLQAETQLTAVKELLDKLEQQQKALAQQVQALSINNTQANSQPANTQVAGTTVQ